MRNRAILAALVAAALLAGCSGPAAPSQPVTVTEDFEKGIRQWQKGADVPQDPNQEDNETVNWRIATSRERSVDGDYSVEFTLDGSQDDGTIWLERPLKLQDGQAYEANVTIEAYSASESFNEIAHIVLYLGIERPIEEEDFPAPGENTTAGDGSPRGGLRAPLNQVEGWKSYGFSWSVPADNNGTLWAAFGISAVWETEMTYNVDALSVTMTPVSADEGDGGSSGPY